MTIKVLHRGVSYNADLNKTGLNGDVDHDRQLAYIQSLKGGRLVAIGANGVALADADEADTVAGVLLNDAAGYFMENAPALASGKAPIMLKQSAFKTDQYVSGETYAKGDLLYCGSGANAGLFTKVKPVAVGANTAVVGIADSATTPTAPELTVLFI